MPLHARAPLSVRPVEELGRPTPPARRRRLARRLALLVAAPLLVAGLAACEPSSEQEAVRALVNDSRAAQGVHALDDDVTVRLKAQAWAEHLAARGTLGHSDLTDGLDAVPWLSVAENVGRGPSIRSVHESYLSSSRHRRNILDPRWDRIGTGHAVGADGDVYTVQVFVDVG